MPYISSPIRSNQALKPDNPRVAEIARALAARTQGGNAQTKETARYLSGFPVDYEGMLTVYAQKYGTQAAEQLLQQLPNMTLPQLRQVEQQIAGAGRQDDMMRDLLLSGAGGMR